jgi:hypothetical protein
MAIRQTVIDSRDPQFVNGYVGLCSEFMMRSSNAHRIQWWFPNEGTVSINQQYG